MNTTFVLVGKESLMQKYGGSLTVDEIKNLKIAVIKNDIGQLLLKNTPALKDVETEIVSYPRQAAKMLHTDRVDLWCYGIEAVQYIMQDEGFEGANYKVAHRFGKSSSLYFAFNKRTSLDIVKEFQASLDKLKQVDENGQSVYLDILENYSINLDVLNEP